MSSPVALDKKNLKYLLAALSERERAYVDARAAGSPPVVAARLVGYQSPEEKAVELEKNLHIRSALEYTLRVQVHEIQITRQDVIGGMMDAVRLAQTSGDLVMAWREIGKLVDAYGPIKVEHTGNIKLTQEQVAALPEEELRRLAAIEGECTRVEDVDEVPEEAGSR